MSTGKRLTIDKPQNILSKRLPGIRKDMLVYCKRRMQALAYFPLDRITAERAMSIQVFNRHLKLNSSWIYPASTEFYLVPTPFNALYYGFYNGDTGLYKMMLEKEPPDNNYIMTPNQKLRLSEMVKRFHKIPLNFVL